MKTYELTPEQKKAFKELQKAFDKCRDLKIYIWSNYGTVSGVNGEFIKDIAPDENYNELLDYTFVQTINNIRLRDNADDLLFVRRVIPISNKNSSLPEKDREQQ